MSPLSRSRPSAPGIYPVRWAGIGLFKRCASAQASGLELGVPILGICYGMQLLARKLGGRVEQAAVGEYGRSNLKIKKPGVLLHGLPKEQTCWMSHSDTVYKAPPGFTALASSTVLPVAAMEDSERGIYGIQFHPEVVHTPHGKEILSRFLNEICQCEPDWSTRSFVDSPD